MLRLLESDGLHRSPDIGPSALPIKFAILVVAWWLAWRFLFGKDMEKTWNIRRVGERTMRYNSLSSANPPCT